MLSCCFPGPSPSPSSRLGLGLGLACGFVGLVGGCWFLGLCKGRATSNLGFDCDSTVAIKFDQVVGGLGFRILLRVACPFWLCSRF